MRTNRQTCLAITTAIGCILVLGCTHLRLRLAPVYDFTEEDVRQAVAALAERQEALRNFKAKVSFSIESPDLERRHRFRGNVAVEMPDKLRLVSSSAFGRKVLDLISVGKSFLLYFPSEQKVFYEKEGMEVESLPFSVSPSDIASELFQPEYWGQTILEDVKLAAASGRQMTLDVHSEGRLKRQLLIQPTKWWLVRDELYAEDGTLRVVTVLDRYRQIDGIWVPTHLEAHYPLRETRMVMRLSRIEVNTKLNPKLFVFPRRLVARAQELSESEAD